MYMATGTCRRAVIIGLHHLHVVLYYKSSAVAEMGDRLATIGMG